MALKQNTVTTHGISVNSAYCRVESISLSGKTALGFYVRKYVEKEKPFFEEKYHSCKYDMHGQNPFKQAYEHLKTLDEFEGATDC
jgi:hypothetical protein